MRKLIRNMFRSEAEAKHWKASECVHKTWEKYQYKKVGANRRVINVAKGTHKKNTWNARIMRTENA